MFMFILLCSVVINLKIYKLSTNPQCYFLNFVKN